MRAALALIIMMIVLQGFAATASSRIRADQRHFEAEVLLAQLHTAESAFEQSLSQQIQANGPDAEVTAPTPLPTSTACASPCNYVGGAQFAINDQPDTALASGDTSSEGNDTSYNLERNPLVRQNIVAVQITAYVWPAKGGEPASRCEMVTYRVEAQQPFFSPAGHADCGANVGVALERDGQGCNPNDLSSCDPTGGTETTPTSTVTTAVKPCQDDGAWTCNGATPTPADTYETNTSQNGNQNTGWSSR